MDEVAAADGADFTGGEEAGNVGHGPPPGGMNALVDKIKNFTRPDLPERVVWQPTLDWIRQFYWLHWDAPVANTIVVADLDREENSMRVKLSRDPGGFYVLLSDDLLDIDREVMVFHGKREAFRGVPQRTLSALLLTARRGDPELTFDVRIPLR